MASEEEKAERARSAENDSEAGQDGKAADGTSGQPDERVIALERSLADSRDQLLRRTAEMDNMRRRHQQEREQLVFEGNKRLLTDLLPAVDDLERTLEHAIDENDPLKQGIELVYKNFMKTLERYGVRPMEALGEQFDPHRHDALMEEPNPEVEPGTITRVIQKGYLLRDNVLRHAKVIVAKAP